MKLPIFASCILFILILRRNIRKGRRKQENADQNFWARENRANSVRRKPLDNLDYINIPFDRLPTEIMTEDPVVAEALQTLRDLSEHKIVNLTGYSNTDLKLEYGTANLTPLSEYDLNYTIMVRTLQNWADVLWKADYKKEAAAIMEFAVETRTDISRTYYQLAEYYTSIGEASRIAGLLSAAEELRSANKNTIVRTLQGLES